MDLCDLLYALSFDHIAVSEGFDSVPPIAELSFRMFAPPSDHSFPKPFHPCFFISFEQWVKGLAVHCKEDVHHLFYFVALREEGDEFVVLLPYFKVLLYARAALSNQFPDELFLAVVAVVVVILELVEGVFYELVYEVV
jgi:hypothetical protein